MNFLVISSVGEGVGLAERLESDGNNVLFAGESGDGVIRKSDGDVFKFPADVIIATAAGGGALIDTLKARHTPFLGISLLADRMDEDVAYKRKVYKLLNIRPSMSTTYISVDAWWNGDKCYLPSISIWDMHFMPGDLGPVTEGESVALLPLPEGSPLAAMMQSFTEHFLAKCSYYGPIQIRFDDDLNPVSITIGFVFPWFNVFAESIGSQIGRFLSDIAVGNKPSARFLSNCAFGIRITHPPYPSTGDAGASHDFKFPSMAHKHVWLSDVTMNESLSYTSGKSGNIGTITASGQTTFGDASPLTEARRRVLRTASNFAGMDFQWRNDAGARAEAYYKQVSAFAHGDKSCV